MGNRSHLRPVPGGARGVDLGERLQAARAEEEAKTFGEAIGSLVRAVDVWQAGTEPVPPEWAIDARDLVIARVEKLAEQQ